MTPHAAPSRRRTASLLAATLLAGTVLAGTAAGTSSVHAAPRTTPSPDPAAASESASTLADPLRLDLDRLTPTVVTEDTRGSIKLQGTITNVSDETWTAVNVAPFRSAYPITDPTGLAAAADSAVTDYVGDRLTSVTSITTIDSLAPGETARFSTSVPRSALGSTPGVYWIGVHARGQTETIPRDEFTDGRARTFIPVADDSAKALRSALVLPVRLSVRHEADGRLADLDEWAARLDEGGALDELVRAGTAADTSPISWLVDPAVLHAVAQLAQGNPGWDLAADPEQVSHLPAASPSASASPDDEDEDESDATEIPDASDDAAPEDATAALAAQWLDDFTQVLKRPGADVHALPYGDVDVASLARSDGEDLRAAQTRGLEILTSLGVSATPAAAPVEGVMSASAVRELLPETLVLLDDRSVVTDASAPVPGTGTVAGRRFVTTSVGASEGGPGPEDAGTALAVRQRVVSEAAVRALSGDRAALVVVPPEGWDASNGVAALTEVFSDRTLRGTTLTAAAQASGTSLPSSALTASKEYRDLLVPRANVRAAAQLTRRAALLDEILEEPAALDVQARDLGWSELSYDSRDDVRQARRRIKAASTHVRSLIDKVGITGPAVVTLSGSSGRIGATVTNDLPVPVKVDVEALAGESIEIKVPNPVRVAPDSRNRLLLQADRVQQGVSSVTLRVTTLDGRPVGAEDDFPVRSSQVSGILWLVMLGGAGVLFGAIAFRFFRRGLASRREQGVV